MNLDITRDHICVVCEFIITSMDIGCYAVLESLDSRMSISSIKIDHKDDSQKQCIKNSLMPGIYQLVVYDVDDTGVTYKLSSIAFHNITILPTGLSSK